MKKSQFQFGQREEMKRHVENSYCEVNPEIKCSGCGFCCEEDEENY